jgi:hypothetical protein
MTERWRACSCSTAGQLWHDGSGSGSGHDATRSWALLREAAVCTTLEGEATPRCHTAERHAPHGKKIAHARGWLSYVVRGGGGLGGGLGNAHAQEPLGSAARVPWRQALGHGITVSAAAACCGMQQWCSNAQQCEGTARSAIGSRQRGDATAQHEATLVDARVIVLPKSRRRWGSSRAGEGIGKNDPDRWAPGGGD